MFKQQQLGFCLHSELGDKKNKSVMSTVTVFGNYDINLVVFHFD